MSPAAVRAQRVAVDPDPDRAIAPPEDGDAADALDRLQHRLHVAAHVLAGLDLGARRLERDPQDRLVVVVGLGDGGRLDLARQHAARLGNLVAHVLDRLVEIAAELELDEDLADTGECRRAQAAHPGDGVQVLLEDVGDVLLHALGARALEVRDHHHHRKFHRREVIDAEALEAERARDHDREHHHPGQDRALDRDVGERHGGSLLGFARRVGLASAWFLRTGFIDGQRTTTQLRAVQRGDRRLRL